MATYECSKHGPLGTNIRDFINHVIVVDGVTIGIEKGEKGTRYFCSGSNDNDENRHEETKYLFTLPSLLSHLRDEHGVSIKVERGISRKRVHNASYKAS